MLGHPDYAEKFENVKQVCTETSHQNADKKNLNSS